MVSPAGFPSRYSFAMAHLITAEILLRTRVAVTRFSFQIGSRTAITSVVVILFTGLCPIFG